MGCFPCFSSKKHATTTSPERDDNAHVPAVNRPTNSPSPTPPAPAAQHSGNVEAKPDGVEDGNSSAKAFTFRELATATKNFRQDSLLGEGGIGRVYKGKLQSGQIVAVRQLDRNGTQGSKEFQAEVIKLSQLRHRNLAQITGYCADGDQRLIVYEYLPLGALERHLFDISEDTTPLDWSTRMKIASGVAEGLEYIHETADPPIIYRDLKSSNILLDESNTAKLSEYGLARLLLQNSGDKLIVSPRVVSSYGYIAPEYDRHGEVSVRSDVYSFGVVLLELITGRRAFDTSRPADEQTLVTWAQPYFRDPKRFREMADPILGDDFPLMSLNQAVGIISMCLQEEPTIRPFISDVVAAVTFLALAPPESPIPPALLPLLSSKVE